MNYEEAISELNHELSVGNIGVITRDNIAKALTYAQNEHELLRLYRKHINTLCKKDREGVKNSLFSSEHLAYELYEKIKQLEEELNNGNN